MFLKSGAYILINKLDDVPTDDPLNELNIASLSQRWRRKEKVVDVDQPEPMTTNTDADEAITLAFVTCRIPFRVIANPFFINALKILVIMFHHAKPFLGDYWTTR